VWIHNGWTTDDIPILRCITLRLETSTGSVLSVGYTNTTVTLTRLDAFQQIIHHHAEALCLDRRTDIADWNIYKLSAARTTSARNSPKSNLLCNETSQSDVLIKMNYFIPFPRRPNWKIAVYRPSHKLVIRYICNCPPYLKTVSRRCALRRDKEGESVTITFIS
jgi:hypothetical protein